MAKWDWGKIFDRVLQVFIAVCAGVGLWVALHPPLPQLPNPPTNPSLTMNPGAPWWAFALIGASVVLTLISVVRLFLLRRSGKPSAKNIEALELVENKAFQRERILIDGKRFVGCKFNEVKLIYNGGLFVFAHCSFSPNLTVASDDEGYTRFVTLLHELGFLSRPVKDKDGNLVSRMTKGTPDEPLQSNSQHGSAIDWALWKKRKSYTVRELSRILAKEDPVSQTLTNKGQAIQRFIFESLENKTLPYVKEKTENLHYDFRPIDIETRISRPDALLWARENIGDISHVDD